jgi:nitrogen fixation protein NifZ
MQEPAEGKYQWGQRVRALAPIHNDGTFPDRDADELLVDEGETGEVVQVGVHVESNTPIYLVEFAPSLVVGCLEDELAAL